MRDDIRVRIPVNQLFLDAFERGNTFWIIAGLNGPAEQIHVLAVPLISISERRDFRKFLQNRNALFEVRRLLIWRKRVGLLI
jgi:hypothetical protein